ncbi:MAG: porin [Sphingomonadaceae bacterium]
MKKSLLSIAILGALSNVAFAQSNVTIYGIVDAGIVSERGGIAGTATKLTSGVASASRIGFKGTEDLGGGLSAIFVAETGFRADTGALDNNNSALFNRQSYVGLSSKEAGTLTLGRQYTPYYETLRDVADPFAMGYAGTAKNLFPTAGDQTRTSNSVVYQTPVYEGFKGEVAYTLGEQAGNATTGREYGAFINYTNGPLTARVAYNARNNDTATVTTNGMGHNTLLAVNYDFAIAKAFFAYGKDKGMNSAVLANSTGFSTAAVPASTDSTDLLLGATIPVTGTQGTVMASYIRKDDKNVANRDADQWAVGYSYALSKRTSTYIAYAKIKNKNGASYTVGNNSEAGTGDKAFNLGLKHSF